MAVELFDAVLVNATDLLAYWRFDISRDRSSGGAFRPRFTSHDGRSAEDSQEKCGKGNVKCLSRIAIHGL